MTIESPPAVRRRLLFGIIAISLFMGSVDLTIVATALPAIHRGLGATINWVGWTITIYGLGTVIASSVSGKLATQFGRKRVFLIGVVMFGASSLLCGFASDIYMLIVFRALQSLGGGAFQPCGAGIIADHFGAERGRAIGMFGTVSSCGQLTGPLFGGILVGYLSWRWIFFVNVPIAVALCFLIIKFVPESRPVVSAKTDIRGLLLTAGFVLAAIFGITSLGDGRTAVDNPIFVVPELCALGLLFVFVRHTNRAEAPFIPPRLLRGRGFAVMNSLSFLQGLVTFGVASLIPLYAEQRYHLHVVSAGVLLTARAAGAAALGAIGALSLRRTGYRMPMATGFTAVAVGCLLLSVAPRWGIGTFIWLSVGAAITGMGPGFASPAASNACLFLAPDEVPLITGLRSTFLNLGVIFSVAIDTAILNRSAHAGIMQAHIFWVVAALTVGLVVPLVSRVPEPKEAW